MVTPHVLFGLLCTKIRNPVGRDDRVTYGSSLTNLGTT